MSLDDYLQTTELIDCQGRVSHALTVEPDGSVRVRVAGVAATVEPRTRQVHPPGCRLGAGEYNHAQVVDLACSLAATVGR